MDYLKRKVIKVIQRINSSKKIPCLSTVDFLEATFFQTKHLSPPNPLRTLKILPRLNLFLMNFGKQIVLNICPFGATQNSGCLFCHFELSICYEHLSHRDCIALANDLSFAILSLRDCIALANDLSFAILSRRDCTKYSTPTQKKNPLSFNRRFLGGFIHSN